MPIGAPGSQHRNRASGEWAPQKYARLTGTYETVWDPFSYVVDDDVASEEQEQEQKQDNENPGFSFEEVHAFEEAEERSQAHERDKAWIDAPRNAEVNSFYHFDHNGPFYCFDHNGRHQPLTLAVPSLRSKRKEKPCSQSWMSCLR